MIDPETKRRSQGFIWWSIVCVIGYVIIVGVSVSISEPSYQIVVTEMPKRLYCQPFRSSQENDYHRNKEGFKPVMWQELNKAFYNQSQGKGEVIGQTMMMCFEKLGSSQTVQADTYFYRSVK